VQIGVAHPAGAHPHEQLPRLRFGAGNLAQNQGARPDGGWLV
jgi:hypothetical protein